MELTTIEGSKNKYQELKKEFLDMAQLKSEFDIEKFTVRKEGVFIAHNFHFLMRQYSLTLYELRRILIDLEEKARILDKYICMENNDNETMVEVLTDKGKEEKYVDLEIERTKNEMDLLELSLMAKYKACVHEEKCRQELIKRNGGTAPTNEQYQAEEPAYWKWELKRIAVYQARQAQTGVHQGTWLNIDHLEQPPLLNPDFQVKVLDKNAGLDLGLAAVEIENQKGMVERAKNILAINQKQREE